MELECRYLLIDLATSIWLIVVFILVFVWIPNWIFYSLNLSSLATQLISCFVRMVIALLIGVIGLSSLHLFNGFTLILWYLGCLGIGHYCRNKAILDIFKENFFFRINRQKLASQSSQSTSINLWQRLSFAIVDFLDGGISLRDLIGNFWQKLRIRLLNILALIPINNSKQFFNAIALIVFFNLAIILRWEYPLKQLRFANPNSYLDLLLTQQIITNHYTFGNDIPVFSTLGAILSSIGSIDEMQTIRFLNPLIGLLLLLSLCYCLLIYTKKNGVILFNFICFGCYIFTFDSNASKSLSERSFIDTLTSYLNSDWIRQWTASELELGTIFLLLALACLGNILAKQNTRDNSIDLIACSILITLTAPSLLILIVIGWLGTWFFRQGLLLIVTLFWLGLAAIAIYFEIDRDAAIAHHYLVDSSFVLTLPVAISLFLSFFFLALTNSIELLSKKSIEPLFLIIFISIICNFFLPLEPQINYLEYEMAARKSLEIRTLLPQKQWLIVAPVEQLAQSYSLGWYEDLAQFVNQYKQKVEQLDFHFSFAVSDLFIFVEKRPFIFKSIEYRLPYSVLNDPTYINYRSPTGRAAIEFAAWQMCETYYINHKKSSIYYEDNELKIYHFTN